MSIVNINDGSVSVTLFVGNNPWGAGWPVEGLGKIVAKRTLRIFRRPAAEGGELKQKLYKMYVSF
jgi:hypothetical protein